MTKALAKRDTSQLVILALAIILVFFLMKRTTPANNLAQFNNLESWEWVDWKGNKRQIVVHRETKVS